MKSCRIARVTLTVALFMTQLALAEPLQTVFTYQGELKQAGAAASGTFDLEFELFDALTLGASAAGPIVVEDVSVSQGIFSTELDFGFAPFAGDQLWLEIGVRDGASVGGFTGLSPRQKLTATPYALHAETVAMDAIGSSEIAAASVGASEIDASQVQRRVLGACPSGEAIQSIAGDGSVACEADDVGLSYWTPGATDSLEPDRSVRVQPGTTFPFVVRHASTVHDPQVAITDSVDSEFARLSFYNDAQSFVDPANVVMWTIAARITDTQANDRMNFYNRRFGDVMSLTGTGLVGINTGSPLAPLDLRSDNQWSWIIGNGRGDLYVGDGSVGLSIGVATAGSGTGTARIWTKGGAEEMRLGSEANGDTVVIQAGNVAIGSQTPAQKLDVDGQARIRGLQHGDASNRRLEVEPDGDLVAPAPQTHYYSIPASAFGPESSTQNFSRGGQMISLAPAGGLLEVLNAPVYLPDGATMTEVTVWFVDDDNAAAADIRFLLRAFGHADLSGIILADFSSAGTGLSKRSATTVPAGIRVDNANRYYSLTALSNAWNSSFVIYSVRIAYVM